MKEIQLSRLDLNLLVVFETLMEEGSVAAAADKLGKTPSAVSHALARLRDQVGDPLIVKVGGRMQPSPFALELIEEVRPILRSIKRVMMTKESFDPATSDRVFRIAMPWMPGVIRKVVNAVQGQASGVKLEWLRADSAAYPAVAEGLYDLVHLGGDRRLPDGLEEIEMPPFGRCSFVRKDHPALQDWGLHAWSKWPHLQVSIANDVRSPVDTSQTEKGLTRQIGALISEFAGIGSLLAGTDLIGTFPPILMAQDMQVWGLRALRPPLDFPPFRVRFFWSSRLASDAGSAWLREIVLRVYREEHATAEALVADAISAQVTSGKAR
ncbi:MAG: LysR family transcriptional regulator [Rhodobacter sp.]|nr:LysR family transcriptional regulator [Rhodobacter sp.]